MDSVSRRLELLKLEGLGFSQAEIVKELSAREGEPVQISSIPDIVKAEVLSDSRGQGSFQR